METINGLQIISGIQIDVPADELKRLLLGRLEYHQEKVKAYEKQMTQLVEMERSLADEADRIGKTSNASPKESVQQAITKHKDKSIYYRFVAEHVVANAVYRLSENDLVRIGVQSERYY